MMGLASERNDGWITHIFLTSTTAKKMDRKEEKGFEARRKFLPGSEFIISKNSQNVHILELFDHSPRMEKQTIKPKPVVESPKWNY